MESAAFLTEAFCDKLGPAKVLHLYDPDAGLRAMVVIDNTACGPAIGGVRMAADVSTQEVARLARAMTLKNAAAGLPHGGGKSGIVADPKTADKPRLMRAFGRAIRNVLEYIPGPDMGTDEACMGYLFDETGRAIARPRVLGGIPLDEIGATGFGLAECTEVAASYCGFEIAGARVAIEGLGHVGRHTARYLEEKGARLVAASDTGGTIYHPEGLPVAELAAAKAKSGTLTAYGRGQRLSAAQVFTVSCDILVPAARPDSIHARNAAVIQAKLIVEGANIPTTPEADAILRQRGILVVPDFIANAGGAICGAVEFRRSSQSMAFQEIAERIRANTREVLERSRHEGIEPRRAALELAMAHVLAAQQYRRCYP
jgi:glutamate dehydrogenase (NAD(P)+)